MRIEPSKDYQANVNVPFDVRDIVSVEARFSAQFPWSAQQTIKIHSIILTPHYILNAYSRRSSVLHLKPRFLNTVSHQKTITLKKINNNRN